VQDASQENSVLEQFKDAKNIDLNGATAYIKESTSASDATTTKDVLIVGESVLYHISYWIQGSDSLSDDRSRLDLILSTFKIFQPMVLAPNETKEVRSDELRLIMQVPNEWWMARTYQSDRKMDGFDFETKRDGYFGYESLKMFIVHRDDYPSLVKEQGGASKENGIYSSFEELNKDVKQGVVDLNSRFSDYSKSGQDRLSFWGNCMRIFVKDGEGYYEIWTMFSGFTKEKSDAYGSQLKGFLETVKKYDVIDTSDWKTYRNEEIGFEMKVPKEWNDEMHLIENNYASFVSNDNGVISGVRFSTFVSTSTLEQAVAEYASGYMGGLYENMEEYSVDSWKGYRHSNDLGPSSFTGDGYLYTDGIYLAGDGKYCTISFSSSAATDTPVRVKDIEKWEVALKTLKKY
jgi:hypothetical protein